MAILWLAGNKPHILRNVENIISNAQKNQKNMQKPIDNC